MAIEFACPWCTQTISVDDSKAHERIECPYCNLAVKVPTESTPDLPPPLPLPPQNMEGPQPVQAQRGFYRSVAIGLVRTQNPGLGGSLRPIVEFIFPKRIHRLSFLVRFVATNLLGSWLILALSSRHLISPKPVMTMPFEENWYCYVALFAFVIYMLLFVVLPRVRDTGMSVLWVLLSLFPVVNIFLYLFLIFRAPDYDFESSSNAAEQA